jgi:uncharacterized membrane protein
MRPSRKIIAEFIAVFLMGAVAGGFITWYLTDTRLTAFMSNTADADTLAARINKKYADQYHLTADEQARIQPIIKEMSDNLYQVREKFGVDVISTLDKYHELIAAQLTPEHRDAYEKAVAERHKKLAAVLIPDQSSPNTGGK